MTSNTASSYIEQGEAASVIAQGKAGTEAVSQEHPPHPAAAPWSYRRDTNVSVKGIISSLSEHVILRW